MNARLQARVLQLLGNPSARSRVALLTALANGLNKAIGMILILAAMSWTLPYLGETLTGVWLTIISLVTILAFLDLGLGNAMTNHASAALVAGRQQLSREVSVGLLLVAVLSVMVTSFSIMAIHFLPWQLFFKVPQGEGAEVHEQIKIALIAFSALFGLHIWTNGVIKTLVGMQKAPLAYSLQAALGLVALIVLYGLTRYESPIHYLLVCLMAPPIVAGFLMATQLANQGVLKIREGLQGFPAGWRKFAGLGGYFFLLQLCATLGWGADTLIISSTLGVAAVAPFVLCQRLFQFASQPVAIMATPLWPAYANALACGDKPYIRRLLYTSMGLASLVGGALILLIVVISPWLVHMLVEDVISVPDSLLTIFACWVFLEILGATFAMFLNGLGIVRLQAIIACVYVAVSLPLKFWAIQQWGLTGLVGVGIVSYLGIVVLPYSLILVFKKEKMHLFN